MAKIAILGYGKQGQSAYEYWQAPENQITICDEQTALKVPDKAEKKLGNDYINNLDQFDIIIRSPAIHPKDIVTANTPKILEKVTTVTNEFFRVCPTKNVIGVTGTKGKGTTSSLITKMLEADDQKVHLGGNIGIAPLDLLKNNIQPSDWVVLELANFQLIDLKYSPYIAVCLMVVPEHLDWHVDFNEYINAKKQLFANQKSKDIAIYFAENDLSKSIAGYGLGQKIPYFARPGAVIENDQIKIDGRIICHTRELKLFGRHNLQNVCAAVTCFWQVSKSIETVKSVLTSFAGLEHRLELVKKANNVSYYNDSFASTPDAAMAALEAIEGNKVMIMGGFDRNLDIEHLAKAVASKDQELRKIIIIGASAKRLGGLLGKVGFNNYIIEPSTKKMSEIVSKAQSFARPGDSVVLSPGFASFDMFKNFEDRGQQFKQAVKKL